jgi:hypothetical protein
MNNNTTSKQVLVISFGRLFLEHAACKAVCSCQYYDLADYLDVTSSIELVHIIIGTYDCPLCGKKGA